MDTCTADRSATLLDRVVKRTLVYARGGLLKDVVLERVLTASDATHLRDMVRGHLDSHGVRIQPQDDRAGEHPRPCPPRPNPDNHTAADHLTDASRATAAARRLLRADRRERASQKRVLTADEEVGLSLLMNSTGNPLPSGSIATLTGEPRAAAHAMVIHNVRLVWSVVRQYNAALDAEDLFQHGCIGLLRAVELFNPQHGNKFSTYASHWIRQAITRGIANESRLIRVPVHMQERVAKVRKELARRQVSAKNAPVSDIALTTELSVEQVAECLRLMSSIASLDQPAEAGRETTLGEFLFRETFPSPETAILRDRPGDSAAEAMIFLDDRSRKILRMRYGFDGDDPMTLEEIGDHFGVSRERIRQLQTKALKTLRETLDERTATTYGEK